MRIAASASGDEPGTTSGSMSGNSRRSAGSAAEVQRRLLAGHVVGQDALDRPHRPARVGGALGDFLGVDAAVEDRHLVVQLAPRLAEDGRHLPLDLLRREHPHEARRRPAPPAARVGRGRRQAVGAVEVGDDPVLEDALEVEARLREVGRDRLDLLRCSWYARRLAAKSGSSRSFGGSRTLRPVRM